MSTIRSIEVVKLCKMVKSGDALYGLSQLLALPITYEQYCKFQIDSLAKHRVNSSELGDTCKKLMRKIEELKRNKKSSVIDRKNDQEKGSHNDIPASTCSFTDSLNDQPEPTNAPHDLKSNHSTLDLDTPIEKVLETNDSTTGIMSSVIGMATDTTWLKDMKNVTMEQFEEMKPLLTNLPPRALKFFVDNNPIIENAADHLFRKHMQNDFPKDLGMFNNHGSWRLVHDICQNWKLFKEQKKFEEELEYE